MLVTASVSGVPCTQTDQLLIEKATLLNRTICDELSIVSLKVLGLFNQRDQTVLITKHTIESRHTSLLSIQSRIQSSTSRGCTAAARATHLCKRHTMSLTADPTDWPLSQLDATRRCH